MAIDISKIDFAAFKPHPFPNPIGGDIVEVEDDATITLRYFLVMGGVLTVLILLSLAAVFAFVVVLKWRWARREQATPTTPAADTGTELPVAQ